LFDICSVKFKIILFFYVVLCSLHSNPSLVLEEKIAFAENLRVVSVVIEHIKSNIPNSDSYSSKTNLLLSFRNLKREFSDFSFSIFKNLTEKYLTSYQIICSAFHQVNLGFSFQTKSELWYTPIFLFLCNLRN